MLKIGQTYKCQIKVLSRIPAQEVIVMFTALDERGFYHFMFIDPNLGGHFMVSDPREYLVYLNPVKLTIKVTSSEPTTIEDPDYTGDPEIDMIDDDDDNDNDNDNEN